MNKRTAIMKNQFSINKWTVALFMGAMVMTLAAFTNEQDKEWKVPEEYLKMKNPVTADDESLDIGKDLFAKHCKSCHGKYGEGDGPKSEELDTECGDFTSDDFQSQPDGSLFYKTKVGRDDMPEFTKKIEYDEDFWHLVNYMRTLGG